MATSCSDTQSKAASPYLLTAEIVRCPTGCLALCWLVSEFPGQWTLPGSGRGLQQVLICPCTLPAWGKQGKTEQKQGCVCIRAHVEREKGDICHLNLSLGNESPGQHPGGQVLAIRTEWNLHVRRQCTPECQLQQQQKTIFSMPCKLPGAFSLTTIERRVNLWPDPARFFLYSLSY